MSEFQGYAFQAIDRPLSPEQMAELRSISSRAQITTTRFSNFYSYGNFKGDERDMMTRYFDAFVYVANWGTHQLMFRLPADLFDLAAAGAYETETTVGARRAGKDAVLIDLRANTEGGGRWLEEDDADRWLSLLLPVREELLRGDLRALYLGWLAGLQQGEAEDDQEEPPVPPGLASLSGPLRELANFLYLDDDLLSVAAEASRPLAEPALAEALAEWVRALGSREKDDLLLAVMQGGAHVGRALLRRFEKERPRAEEAAPPRRTAGVIGEAWQRRQERERQRAAEEAERERQRRRREEAERRSRHLDALAGQEDRLWRQVEQAVATRLPKQYDEAVERLKDLRDLAGRTKEESAFQARLRSLRQAHAAKRTFVQRLDNAGLTG